MSRHRDAVAAAVREPASHAGATATVSVPRREKTLGKDALKQKKEIVDTTQRKAKQGDKEYVHNPRLR